MKKKTTTPLKISFYGMNDRAQKLMVNSLKMLNDSIYTEVVADNEGQVEIIDLDLSASNPNFLQDRLVQSPRKPIIVLSLHGFHSNEVIYIKKPLQSEALLAALKKATTVLQKKTSVNTGKEDSIPGATLTTRKVSNLQKMKKPNKDSTPISGNQFSPDSKVDQVLPRKIKWARGNHQPDSSAAVMTGSIVVPEIEQNSENLSSLSEDLPRVVKWSREIKSIEMSEDKLTELDGALKEEVKEGNITEDNGIAASSEVSSVEFDVAFPDKLVAADEITMAIKDHEKIDIWADESPSEKKKIIWQRNIAADEFNLTELDLSSNNNPQENKVRNPRLSLENSKNLYEKHKDGDHSRGGRKSTSRTVNRSSFRNEIAKRKKLSHLSSLQSRNLIQDLDLGGGIVNKRRSVRYTFANLKGYFVPNSLILRNKRKSILILDISSKGAYFRCNSKLKLKTKGELVFDFGLAAVYKIPCQIGRVNGGSYSIIFKEYNHEICDFLIDSGRMFEIKTHKKTAKTKRPTRELA